MGSRILPVEVATWMVEDDHYPLPSLGDTVELELIFTEVGDGARQDSDVVTVDAWAEEVEEPSRQTARGSENRWLMVLRGDGWAARWVADRPVIGHVRVTGRLSYDPYLTFLLPIQPTRGRVERIRLAGDGGELDVSEVRLPVTKLADDSSAPFDVRSLRLTLDLDEAAPPEPREPAPSWSCGFAVSGTGGSERPEEDGVLWRADPLRPILWRTDLRGGETAMVTVPVPIHEWGLHPHKVVGPGAGTVTNGCTVQLAGFRRLTVTAGQHGEEVGVAEINRPAGLRREGVDEIVAAPGSREGWIVSRYSVGEHVLEVGRVMEDDGVTWVYEEVVGGPSSSVGLVVTDAQIMVCRDNALRYLDDDLRCVREATLPREVVDGFAEVASAGPWITVRLMVRATCPEEEGSRMFLVDPETLEIAFNEPCGRDAQVQADGRNSVWLADGSLRLFTRDGCGDWASRTMLDVP